MNTEQKLNNLIIEFQSLKTEKEKTVFDEKLSRILVEMSQNEREAFRKAFLHSAKHTISEAKEIKKEVELKMLLSDVDNYLSLSQIAQDYFGKTRSWLYHRINGSIVNGKPAKFTPEEQEQLSNALLDISNRIKNTALKLKVN